VSFDAATAPQVIGGLGLYARVSSHDQQIALEGQVARLPEWAANPGHRVVRVEAESASGMNGCRSKARRLLPYPVEDDLVRDVAEVLAWFCARLYGRRSAKNRARKAWEAA
jgi:putative resolvase